MQRYVRAEAEQCGKAAKFAGIKLECDTPELAHRLRAH
jgi:hypothetical protein